VRILIGIFIGAGLTLFLASIPPPQRCTNYDTTTGLAHGSRNVVCERSWSNLWK
jgi:hypothetical protein